MNTRLLIVSLLAFGPGAPAFAHHGDAGRYKETATTVSGTVVALQLVNPHALIMLDVPDETGELVRWQAELTGAAQLVRNFGWSRTTLKVGDRITVTGRPIRSGAPYLKLSEHARIVRTDSGEEVFSTED